MPFDGTTFGEVLAEQDVLSLESLIAWLETMPAEGEYCYLNTGGCLIFQYLQASGVPVQSVAGSMWRDTANRYHDLSLDMIETAVGRPRTYSAALSRARALRGVS